MLILVKTQTKLFCEESTYEIRLVCVFSKFTAVEYHLYKISGVLFSNGFLIIFAQNPFFCLVIIELAIKLTSLSDDYVCDDDDYGTSSRMIW